MHGLRVCPDLDTCMYTLGGGVDPERGWGHRDETWHAKEELARYGVQPDWFQLGDRDLATHLVRTQMLHAGYPLSQITTALCDRWQPGARLLPASDDRCETHVVITDPADDSHRAIHFQEWWVRYRAQVPTHSFAFVGAEKASATTEAVAAIADADVILLAPSNPVVSVGAILAVPGIRGALRSAAAPVVGYSPIIGGKPLRGMADECLTVIGVESTAEAVGRHYGARRATGILDCWLVHEGDRGRHRGGRGALDTAADDRPEGDGRDGQRRAGPCGRGGVTAGSMRPGEHGTASAIEILPVTGLPEFRPGDDLSAALAAAAPWLRDGDVVVVTSKVVSKCEGRLVPAPQDPEERDPLRRKLVDDEAVRVLARKGRTLITENRLGLVQAAAGVDGSNVGRDELALLPVDPDASAAALRAGLRERLGVDVAVVITDTMGRAWRNGQIDAAVGAAGLAVLHGYAGAVDRHGNELLVTEVAIADEIAAAADLVKGKLTAIPVAVVRGLAVADDGTTARQLVRPGDDDLFWLGTAEALEMGRRQAQLLRRSVRRFAAEPVPPDLIEAAVAEALTAPAPHHTRPVRFVWLQTPATRTRLLDRMRDKWRSDLTGDGRPADAVERRVARGQILYDAPEVVIPILVPDGAHSYPDAARTDAEHTMFTVAVGAAVQALLVALAVRGVGSCWIGSTIFAADLVRAELELPDDWEPLGAIAIGYPARAGRRRATRPTVADLLVRK